MSLFHFNPLPDNKILDRSKLKQSADYNFKFDENSRKFSKWVGSTRYEQFLLFPQCFQRACFPGASKGVIMWEWVKVLFFGGGGYLLVIKLQISNEVCTYQSFSRTFFFPAIFL